MSLGTAARLCLVPLAAGVLLSGCGTVREVLGLPAQNDPSVQIRSAESRWLLIKNPRFGDVASEPEYIWVEEDKLPTTLKSLVFGKSSLLATPEVVAKYGSPPGGGRISPRQKLPYQAEDPQRQPTQAREPIPPSAPAVRGATAAAAPSPAPAPAPQRGFVVFVDTTRVVIDLTARDGVRPGTIVSLRRDKIPIVHPITGELLGELDEEVATGRVTEVREKFSVIEVQGLSPGGEIKIKDRVVVR